MCLLQRRANQNTQSRGNGGTPVHHTATKLGRGRCNEPGIHLLVSHGALTSIVDRGGNMALDILFEDRNFSNCGYLLTEGQIEDKGWAPKPNKFGKTMLHEAYLKGFLEIVGTLINAGADVNLSSATGWTPVLCSLV